MKTLPELFTDNFTLVRVVGNSSKRKVYSCDHCSTEIEHRDNRLAQHLVKCDQVPSLARSAAHLHMSGKKPSDSKSSEASEPLSKKRKLVQGDLDGAIETRAMSELQQNTANRKLFKYLVHTNSPFSNADNIFLSDFTNELRPSFQVASRYVASRVHLQAVEDLYKLNREATLLIDGWEDLLRRSLYGKAAARIGQPSTILGLKDVTGQCGQATTILETAESAMADMGIENASCFLALVTDNPNVMKSFRKLFEKKYIWILILACFVHQLNTLIGEICQYLGAKKTIQLANKIVTFFNSSHFWGGQLKMVATAEEISRGLKSNCESRCVVLHQTPLGTLIARPDARKPTNGLSAINADVVKAIQDHNDTFWPMLKQIIRVAKPFVDVIAACEGRSATLADCMLHLLGAAYKLSVVERHEEDDKEFFNHARAVVDKRFRLIATPLHRLALFLHPLCRKFTVLDAKGYTLRDYKCECRMLCDDIDKYHSCRDKFAGGDKDAHGPPLEKRKDLERWEQPMATVETDGPGDDQISGVDAVFVDLEARLAEEDDGEDEEEDFPPAPAVVGGTRKGPRSLMKGEIYDFKLVKKALDNVIPVEESAGLNVVKDKGGEDWSIDDLV
ncbi:DUF659 domain-containing protein [Favolaschia claudopus]|uniref:DUF659 domain-containing protein n=1 Tax=Favolaschia claudopus TaxID=2862362 RepID=A0AAW0AJE3_9AGAR